MKVASRLLAVLLVVVISAPLASSDRFGSPRTYYIGYVHDLTYEASNIPVRPIRFGDFNNDEIVDLLVINESDSTLFSILYGRSDGTFDSRVDINIDCGSSDCKGVDYLVIDADHDGFDDVVSALDDWYYYIHLNEGSVDWTTETEPVLFSDMHLSYLIGACDCNDDGHEDFIGFSNQFYNAPTNPHFVIKHGRSAYPPYFSYVDSLMQLGNSNIYPLGDFNGDGRRDFLGSDYINFNYLYVFCAEDNCQFTRIQTIYDNLGFLRVAVGDFNGDGYDDIAYVQLILMNCCVHIYYGYTTGFNTAKKQYEWLPSDEHGCDSEYVVAVDVNGDGLDDIGVVNGRPIKWYDEQILPVYFHLSAGDTFLSECDTLILPSSRRSEVWTCDFNDDGLEDLCYCPAMDTIAILLHAGPTATLLQSFDARFVEKVGVVLEWSVVGVEDCREFLISRSLRSEPFSLVGTVAAGTGIFRYQFTDGAVKISEGGMVRYRLEAVEEDGSKILLALEGVSVPGAALRLYQNYPNPFNPGTRISFDLPAAETVWLEIFDVTGKLVRRVVGGEKMPPGTYIEYWDGTNEHGEKVASGVYYYRLKVGKSLQKRKMVVLQ